MSQSLVAGTLILTGASLIARLIGVLYRVYLVRLIGPEVIGLFQMIFPLYFTLIILASAGLPMAVSRMVAERRASGRHDEIRQVVRIALIAACAMGLTVTLLLFALARPISYRLLTDGRTLPALLIITPALPAIAISSTLKGYFQGMACMVPVGVIQVVEQFVHIIFTIAAIRACHHLGEAAITGALAFGSLAGDIVGLILIASVYRFHNSRLHRRGGARNSYVGYSGILTVLREMFSLAAPVTAGRLVISLNSAINAALVPALLRHTGMPQNEVTIAYGELTGMAMTILTIPAVLTSSMSTNLVWSVTASFAQGSTRSTSAKTWHALSLVLLAGSFFSVCFLTFGPPICKFLFGSYRAGILLAILAPGGLALYLQHILTGVFQGLGRPKIPAACSLASTAASTVGLYIVIGRMGMGIEGAAFIATCAMLFGFTLSLTAVKRTINLPSLLPVTARVFIASICGAAVGLAVYRVAGLVMGIAAMSIVYLALVARSGPIKALGIPLRMTKRK